MTSVFAQTLLWGMIKMLKSVELMVVKSFELIVVLEQNLINDV